jgi:TRAP-type C4-dicarboxylate transport system substrate-binding protein
MTVTRRLVLGGIVAAPAVIGASRFGRAAGPTVLKISHQFPGGTIDSGDFRDRLCRKFVAEVEARTKGEVTFQIYPNSSLMKTVAQFSALRKGALDLSLYPLAYAGGEVQELNIGLMPCLVTSYDQGLAWRKAEIGAALTDSLDKKGVKILTWIWQAGGVASRAGAVINPDDVKGLKVRGGSREMDLMLKAAGGIISSVPSNEIYAAMQTGSLDAAVTSSTSLISFRLEEISKNLTTGRGKSFWYMLEPLLMSKSVFDALTPAQQKAMSEVGESLQGFGVAEAKKDDDQIAAIYTKAGVKVQDMDAATIERWRKIAEAEVWKDFADRNAECARFLKLARAVAAA